MSDETRTPTEDLFLEVLAGRRRAGEISWTFEARHSRTARTLADKGLIGWKGGVVQHTIRAWLTPKGEAEVLDPEYSGARHASRGTGLMAWALENKDRPVETQYWRQTRKCDGSTGLWGEWTDEFDIDTEYLAHERENVRLMNRSLKWAEFRVVRKTSRITELP